MGASANVFSTWDPLNDFKPTTAPPAGGAGAGAPGGGRGFGGGGFGGAGGTVPDFLQPRVILRFPSDTRDMLLSGGVLGSENLSDRPQLIDAPIGKGHVVMFAIRPFWRWQTQGTFILGFNTLMHWNDLDAGKGK